MTLPRLRTFRKPGINLSLCRFMGIVIAVSAIGCCTVLPCGAVHDIHAKTIDIGHFRASGNRQGIPDGWQLLRHKGNPVFMITQDEKWSYLTMTSRGRTAFGIRKEISVDIHSYPYLHWNWKAIRLPEGGDIRRRDRDDQALQIYMIFPGAGFPELSTSPTIAYIWDNEAPKGLMTRSPQPAMGYVRYIVIRNKTDALGNRCQETRNILEDYRKLFADISNGEPQGPVRSILLFINTHHKKGEAEGQIGDIYFSQTGKGKSP